jgi:glutathione reductase (NADPH)
VSSYDYDVIVIGTGVAGQTVAEELATAGKRVLAVDRREFGGTCALRGCEPKKALYAVAEAAERAQAQSGNGLLGEVSVDWAQLIDFKRTFTDSASASIEGAITGAGAEALRGTARFRDADTIEVDGVPYTAEHIVVATGAMPRPLDIPGAEFVLTSEQFMTAETIGPRVTFIGGGYISFEFAHISVATGARVTIVHRGGQVLAGFDPQLADMLADSYRQGGIEVLLDSPVAGVEDAEGERVVVLGDGSRIACDTVVHGAGRVPDLDTLELGAGGVGFGRGGIEVDEHMRSCTNPRVWAAGDAAAWGAPLTPVGIAQARVIVRGVLGDEDARFAPTAVASVVFSDPPLASVGLTEEQATAQGIDVEVKFSDTSSWASSRRTGMKVGGAKVLVERVSGRIAGAHLLGPHADEMINVFMAAVAGGMTAKQLRATLWAYPTAGSEIVYMV